MLSYFSTIESCFSSDTEYLLFLVISEAYTYSKSNSSASSLAFVSSAALMCPISCAFDISFAAISMAVRAANSVASTVETVYLSGYDSMAGITQSR